MIFRTEAAASLYKRLVATSGIVEYMEAPIGNPKYVRSVEFSNGCWLSLEEDDGILFGNCPYNLSWACNAGESCTDAIKQWLAYWNEDRTETGSLIRAAL